MFKSSLLIVVGVLIWGGSFSFTSEARSEAVLKVYTLTSAVLEEEESWRVSLLGGQMINATLKDIPYRIVSETDTYFNTYLAYASVSKLICSDVFRKNVKDGFESSDSFKMEYELGFAKHFGLQDHLEFVATFLFRTPGIKLSGVSNVNFAIGEGFSYAFERPAYEKGKTKVRGVGSVKFQNYLPIEAVFNHESYPRLSLVWRNHHRSGIFGIISSKSTAANYLTMGVRYSFK